MAEVALLQCFKHALDLSCTRERLAEEDLLEELSRIVWWVFSHMPAKQPHDRLLISCVLVELQVDLVQVELLKDEFMQTECSCDAVVTLSPHCHLLII